MSLPPLPPGFRLAPSDDERRSVPPPTVIPTGEAHDGDTFRLNDGRNARLYGVDAFELQQQGRDRRGQSVALGAMAREKMGRLLASGGAKATPTGAETYGRPVMSLTAGGEDAGKALLADGLGLATPQYLRGDQPRLADYLEAERQARLNRRGAFADTFDTPTSYRHKAPDPWASPEPGKRGESTAVFFDDPTPFQGLRSELEKGYLGIWQDMSSTPDDLIRYAQDNGFGDRINPDEVRKQYEKRAKSQAPAGAMAYRDAPKLNIDPGDGKTGAALRGFGDVPTFGLLDELGGVVDTLGGTAGRESLWNSDRRFGDILANNIGQNQAILRYDEREHPWARFGGQVAGSLVPIGGAITSAGQAFRIGAAGGLAYGLGSSDADSVTGRIPDGLLGLAAGGATGVIGQKVIDFALPKLNAAARKAIRGRRGLDPDWGQFGPIHYDLAAPKKWDAAIKRMASDDAGEIPGAIKHPEAGNVDLIWGSGNYGVKHVAEAYPDALANLPRRIEKMKAVERPDESGGRWVLEDGDYRAVISPDADGTTKRLVVSEFGPKSADDAAIPPLPEGFALKEEGSPASSFVEGAITGGDEAPDARDTPQAKPGAQAMANETASPALEGPDVPDMAATSSTRPLLDPVNDAERRAQAQRVDPSDVLPIPANTIDGVDEAARIDRGRYEAMEAPNERDALAPRSYPSPRDGTRTIRKRGPADLVTWLRTQGGLRPQGGELQRFGIDNAPRKMDFAGNEQQLGRLVDADNGMSYDEAAERAWEAGFFPDHAERPTIGEFLDAVQATHSGGNRVFHPDDFAEVDDFLAQRQQRYAVESAKQEGVPLTNDRGEPIGLDDLDANAAPVTAYEEWGENAPNLAGNIRLDKLDSPKSIKRALASVERVTGGFDTARRGRIRMEETKALAADLNMSAADLMKRRKGEAFNAEQALAARQLLAKSGNELVTLAQKVRQYETPGDEALSAFREAWVRHVAIQEQVAGMTAEAGRVLSQFRIIADGRVPKGKVLPGLLSEAGGADRVQQAAEMILDNASDPAALNATAKRVLKPGWQDKLTELWYNSLLSGPQTHVVNVMSNTLTAAGQIPEHALAAGIGGLRRLVVPQRAADAVLFSEVGSRAIGMLQGAREGIREARRAIFTGESSDAVSRLETQPMEAIPGVAGKVIRMPTRLLSAEDELFKAIARRMELAGLATRKAGEEGLRGAEAKTRAAELLANPSDEMLERAFDYARYITFQKPLGPVGRQITAITQAMPLTKLVVPFVRTPTNLLKYALERSPGAPILKEWRDDMRAGGARRDLAAAKVMLGSGLMAMVAEAVVAGHLTGGGPADEDAKALLRADDWQPYSVRIGDKYYSYQRLDPISSTIGVAADWVDLQSHMTAKQSEDVATRLGVATLKNLGNKTWLSGMSDLLEALNDPDRSLKSYESRLAGSLAVPAVVAQVARTIDPVVRDAKEPLDRIRSRIPGMSSGIAPKRDVFGRVVKSEGGIGPNIVSPVWTSTRAGDPTVQALLDAGAGISKPSKKVGDRVLTPEEYDLYQAQTGKVAKPRLDQLVRERAWLALDPEGQQDAVRKVMKGAREEARATLFGAPVRKSKRPAATHDLPPLPPGFKMREVPPLPDGFRMVR